MTSVLNLSGLNYGRGNPLGNQLRNVQNEIAELKKEIASKKQALRDVTKTELPNTLEEIKATWPEILGEKPF